MNQPRFSFCFGLATQIADVHLERVPEVGGRNPRLPRGSGCGEHPARVGDEHLEQGELGPGEADRPLAAVDLTGGRIQGEVGEGHDRRLGGLVRAGAAEQSPQPGQQFLQREWLGQIVVGAGIKPGDAFGHRVAGGQHQDGQIVAGAA